MVGRHGAPLPGGAASPHPAANLVQRLLALIVAMRAAARLPHRVELVDEENSGRRLVGTPENVADAGCAAPWGGGGQGAEDCHGHCTRGWRPARRRARAAVAPTNVSTKSLAEQEMKAIPARSVGARP